MNPSDSLATECVGSVCQPASHFMDLLTDRPDWCMTPEQISDRLGVDVREAKRLILREMRFVRIGPRTIRVQRKSLANWERLQANFGITVTQSTGGEECDLDADRISNVGLVYFIEAAGAKRIKIGWTGGSDARERLRSLQTASPFELGLLMSISGRMSDEFALHRQFRGSRVSPTTEWFHATPGLWSTMSGLYDCDAGYGFRFVCQAQSITTAHA